MEDLVSCDCIADGDMDILRKINFHRCIEAYLRLKNSNHIDTIILFSLFLALLSDVREFRTLSSLKQVAVEEVAVKLNLFLHEELLHLLRK